METKLALDFATLLTIIGGIYTFYKTKKNEQKEIRRINKELECKEKEKSCLKVIAHLPPLINYNKKIIMALNTDNFAAIDFSIIQEQLNAFFNASFDAPTEILNSINETIIDFNFILKNETNINGVNFIINSIIMLTYKLYSYIHGEKEAKKFTETIFQNIIEMDVVIKNYNDYKEKMN